MTHTDVTSACADNTTLIFKQDVVSSGYVPYGTYVRDYNPPLQQPIYASTQLNVADPRFSATYGNPYLKQVGTTQHFVKSLSDQMISFHP